MAHTVLTKNKERFYRGRFTELIASFSTSHSHHSASEDFEQQLLRSAALYELHYIHDAISALQFPQQDSQITPASNGHDPIIGIKQQKDFLTAQSLYLKNEKKEALNLFETLCEQAESEEIRFNALLRTADLCYNLKNYTKLILTIARLQEYEPLVALDQRLSLLLLFGKSHLKLYQSSELAKRSFRAVLSASMREGWDYFTLRSLYGLATVAVHEEKAEELHTYLSLLKCLLEDSEHIHMIYLVNHKFKHILTIDTFLEMDLSRQRIFVHDHWIDLSEHQDVFELLVTLKNSSKPLSHAQLQTHLTNVTESSIKARKLIERFDEKPHILLEDSQGFLLAVK